jgi:hypothetical protein
MNASFGGRLGGFIGELRLHGELGVWFAETGTPGHLAIWARPDALQRSLIAVEPV